MEFAGLGTTVVFLLAALIWLAYLVPVWTRRREYVATERNAVRLQQTLRVMAETAEAPETVRIAADSKQVARQQRLLAKEERLQQALARAREVARAREIDDEIKAIERQVRIAVQGSISRRERLRRTRLACSAMLAASVGVGVAGALLPGATLLLALAGVVGTLAIVGLGLVNHSSASVRQASVEPAADVAVAESKAAVSVPFDSDDRRWTPVPVPPQLQPSFRLADQQRAQSRLLQAAREQVAAAATLERDTRPLAPVTPISASFDELVLGADTTVDEAIEAVHTQAAEALHDRAPANSPAPSDRSRFAAMGTIDEQAPALDVRAAFRRRAS